MFQKGQVFELTTRGRDGERLWAYRFRVGGRGSKRIQRGGFASEQDAREALERELERLRRERRIPHSLTLSQLVESYLAQHDVQPVTIEKLRWLLAKATAVFGERRIGELTSQEIASWRMTLAPGDPAGSGVQAKRAYPGTRCRASGQWDPRCTESTTRSVGWACSRMSLDESPSPVRDRRRIYASGSRRCRSPPDEPCRETTRSARRTL